MRDNNRDELEYELISKNDKKREEWRLGGVLHSINDEPAVIIEDGEEMMWYKHGLRHREGGPAWVQGDRGIFMWYNCGQLHRTDGPAIVGIGQEQWFVDGQMHRNNGPAILRKGKADELEVQWWLHGEMFSSIDEWAESGNIDGQILVMNKIKYLGKIPQ